MKQMVLREVYLKPQIEEIAAEVEQMIATSATGYSSESFIEEDGGPIGWDD